MMNKIFKKQLIGLLFIICHLSFNVALTSCDSYIDITPKGKITVDSVSQYYQLIVYPMRSYWPSSFILLSDDQWVLESNVLGYESSSADGINFTFNEAADRTILGDNNLYENMYNFILRSNMVIDNVDQAIGDEALKILTKAEARTYRAWDHFLAVNTYAKAYDPATAAQDGGVCIVDHVNLEESPKKSTVAEVYNFIIKELEESVPLLEEKPVNIYHPNRAFGYALLAKVYLFHRDWEKAKTAAEEAMKLNPDLADYNLINKAGSTKNYPYFAKDGNPEVLSYMWMSGWGSGEEVCLLRYGIISPELKALFKADPNDLRYRIFFRDREDITSIAQWMDFHDTGSDGVGISKAAIWMPDITNIDRFTYMSVGMRTAEVYLMLAEVNARLGDLTTATDYVNQLRAKRVKGTSTGIAVPATQKDMMDQIILERRKELLFGFNRFFDLKRFNLEPEYQKTITRQFPLKNISDEHPQQTYTLQPDSRLYIIPFPKSARDRNSNLTLNTNE